MNALYRNLILERVRYALAAAKVAAELEHNGVMGALRESLMTELFRPLIPQDFGIATGVIISADGLQSPQQDIVIYNKSILPPLLTDGPAIVPIESVVATIEVKSTLTAKEIQMAYGNAYALRRFRMLSGVYGPDGNTMDVRVTDAENKLLPPSQYLPPSMTPSFLFAYRSDLIEKSEGDRLVENLGDAYTFAAICIVGKGLYGPSEKVFWDHNRESFFRMDDPSKPLSNRIDQFEASDETHPEIMVLIANLHGLVRKVARTRGYPPLDSYLLDEI